MRLLVAGSDRVDAGKTTFSTGLIHRLDGVGFKPRAGNDYWFDNDDVRRAVSEGRLYGKDARRLAAASRGDPSPERINPIHRLWRPDPGPGTGVVGQSDRRFVLDRVAGSLVVNAEADLPGPVREGLPVEDAVPVRSLADLNGVTAKRHVPALHAVGARIRETDPAVVESYGDIARPLQGTLPEGEDLPEELYDAVAVVEPGRVRVYDGRRYVRACDVATTSARDGSLERRVEDVLVNLDARATLELPPLDDDARSDPHSVADHYAPAYDALLETAER